MKTKIFAALACAFFGCLALSCSKSDNPDAPVIESIQNAEDGMEMLKDQSVTFRAKVSVQAVYTWSVNGQAVAQTPDYTFAPGEAGRYKLAFEAENKAGIDRAEFEVVVLLFKGGFFVLNEGSFGYTMGSVDHWSDLTAPRTQRVYATANPGMELGNTSDFIQKWDGNFYFVSKQGRKLIKASAVDFKDGGTFSAALAGSEADGRSFAGIDGNYGVYTTANGAYVVDLKEFKAAKYLEESKGSGSIGASSECGGVIAAGDYILVINVQEGVLAYRKSDFSFVKNVCPAHIGFVRSKEGYVWASDGPSLYCIDPVTLTAEKSDLPAGLSVYTDQWAWKPAMFDASPTQNVLYFANAKVDGFSVEVQDIYKCELSSKWVTSVERFVWGETGEYLYGGGFRVDPATGDILAIFLGENWGGNRNKLALFDGRTGSRKAEKQYDGYFYPTMILFNN